MKTAIVILNWNGKKLLEKFLPSIVKYNAKNVTIYIADNASTDNSVSFVKEVYPEIKIVINDENGGYAKGYNDALKYIDADIYCLLNSDIEVTEKWLEPVIETFEKKEQVAIIQPKILDYKDKKMFEYAGAAGGYIDLLGYPYCRGRVFNHLEKDINQFNDISEIFWASGACLFIRSKVFHALKGFDEDYFAHQEEIDLCWRAQNKGHIVNYVGLSTVYHVGGATLKETNPHKTFLNFRNSLLTCFKNTPDNLVFFIVLSRLVLDGIAGIKFLIELRPIHTLSIIKAHFSFYRLLPRFISKRRQIQHKTKKYYNTKSIVWQYFILNRKKFKNLR